jgi:hypothetical protein
MISVKLVSEVDIKMDPILQVVLEHLKELRKAISASQEELKNEYWTFAPWRHKQWVTDYTQTLHTLVREQALAILHQVH